MAARLEIRPLSPGIGVEILGVDLSEPLDEPTFVRIREAWEQNCVALFRGQSLDEAAQVRFAGRFGPLGQVVSESDPAKRGEHPSVLYVSNIRINGKLTGVQSFGPISFHADQCYIECPAMASVLYAIEIPAHGGNTLFASGFRAYEALPPDLKQRLAGRRALNFFDPHINGSHRIDFLPPSAKRFAHPVCRTHPPTGRKSLYVNRLMTWAILDMPHDESEALLEEIFTYQERREFIYEHVWQAGDVLLWDNRSCVHARTTFDPEERRRLRRVTVLGEKPYE